MTLGEAFIELRKSTEASLPNTIAAFEALRKKLEK